jgi:cystathionine gamma-synthase
LIPPGSTIVCAHDCYGGTHRLLQALAARGQFRVEFIDLTADDAATEVVARTPSLVWIETPSNPLLRISDIGALCGAARSVGALSCVDNTFLSPVLQRPLTLGADLVIHSTTKYLNGHSDVVGGAVVASSDELVERLGWWANCLGITGAPFDSYLTLRGVRTVFPRIAIHEENARAVVATLSRHEAVSRVYYPGLSTHAGHALAARQQDGFGAMVSFELHGDRDATVALVDALRCFTLAESLGGVESLIAHPATMTHASMDPAARVAAGISDRLFRLSVGIENAEDLTADLVRGLDAAVATLGQSVFAVA